MRLFLLSLVFACSPDNTGDGTDDQTTLPPPTDTDTTPDTDTDTVPLPTGTDPWPAGWLRVRVNRATSVPTDSGRLEGAHVFVSGLEAVTDNWGLTELTNVALGPHAVEVHAVGAPLIYGRSLQVPVVANALWLETRDLVVWNTDAETGGTFVDGKLALDLPASVLLDPLSVPAVGPVEVGLLAVTPDSAGVLPPMAGGDEATSYVGYAAGYLRFSANQQNLTLTAPVLLTLPVFALTWDPQAVHPVQRWDTTTGSWIDAGLAESATVDTVTVAADVAGWWMVGEALPEQCMSGRVMADGAAAGGASVRVRSPDALVHGTTTSVDDGGFCACGPTTVALTVDAWGLRAPSDELIGRTISVPAAAAPGSTCATGGGATALGDLVADPVGLTCATGTLDPAVAGCILFYGIYDGATNLIDQGEVVVPEDGNPAFCLTVPADLGDGGLNLAGSYAVFDAHDSTCSMAQCDDLGTVAAACPP